MSNHSNICPYPGLRSFTEEESLYFKGRDLQIDQISALLEQNKFLMVTGASGEGKSSLIYAGLIPNARAGFFKAKFTNWVVADFRPERSPLKNMADSLAETFSGKSQTIETELKRGFSSLIDLYLNSPYYLDDTDEQWQALPVEEQKERKRKSANLLLIVDQFEEFFTNPENFQNETPSQDSQVVVNLVLETARIAIRRNIPVYVVCTMRSDYIGQCSAFRGLPEYIGFSQFFVPRLKRKDLKQVIEEPAILSGNRISQRLIERLVYDVAEGVDQLPILQHALNQIWMRADRGNDEMDLLHYAMVGGMPALDLPDEDATSYNKWFEGLPESRKKYYEETGLTQVIEIHASLLYETAWEYYNRAHPQSPISQKDAKRIIALSFSCLTKIDHSRAVRNRMSLAEITSIINNPTFTPELVGEVLSIYREEGNSFIRPFKTEDPATHHLSANTVLDITHESLIRNWKKLNTWARQEFEFYTTYLDFKKQMDRWKSSGRSSNYLLPIGPLTYFENWYNKCKPNVGWIRRYTEVNEIEKETPILSGTNPENVLSDSKSFLKRSARKLAVSRAFMKYGAQKIAVVVAIAAMVILTGFYWYDAEQKQNGRVVREIRNESFSLLKSKEVNNESKSYALLMEERYEPGSMVKTLNSLTDKDRLGLAIETYRRIIALDQHDTSLLKRDLLGMIHKTYDQLAAKNTEEVFLLKSLNQTMAILSFDTYYNPSPHLQNSLREFANKGYQLALSFYKRKDWYDPAVSQELNYCIQQWLSFGSAGMPEIDALLSGMSPLENEKGKEIFSVYYPKGSYEINGRVANDFNGGYHTLASLYAAKGDADKLLLAYDALKTDNQTDYFTGSLFNNYNNILGILYQFGHRDKAPVVVKWLGTSYPTNTPTTIYRNAMIRAGYISYLYRVNIFKQSLRSYKGYYYPNLCLADRKVFNAIADDYDSLIKQIPNPNEKNYLLALNKKRKAIFIHKYNFDRGFEQNPAVTNALFDEAIILFRQIPDSYLEELIPITFPYFSDGVRTANMKRRHILIYPDYMDGWFSWNYHSDVFYNYILEKNLLNELYKSPQDIERIHYWLAKAYEVKPFFFADAMDNNYPVSDSSLYSLINIGKTHPHGHALDLNLVYLLLANRAFERNDTAAAITAYNQFDKNNFAASRDKYEYLEKTFFLNQLKQLCANLALAGRHKEATELAEKFERDHEKAYAYLAMADKLYVKQLHPLTFTYLDSVYSISKKVDFSQFNFGTNQHFDFRSNLILLLSRIGGKKLNALSNEYLREFVEEMKFGALVSSVYGIAEEGNFYRAKNSLPSTLTDTDELDARTTILWQACRKKEATEATELNNLWQAIDRYFVHYYEYKFFIPI